MGPVRGPFRRYYTPYEVAIHNSAEDCWVSFLGKVYDLTQLIQVSTCEGAVAEEALARSRQYDAATSCLFVQVHPGHLAEPIIQAAGNDLSHW